MYRYKDDVSDVSDVDVSKIYSVLMEDEDINGKR